MYKLFLCFFLLISCRNDNLIEKNIQVKGKDKCVNYLNENGDTIKFDRKNIEIIKNTVSDTILFGNTILPPKKTGKFEYARYKDGNMLDLKYKNPPTKEFCIFMYKHKFVTGILVLRIKPHDSM